MAKPKHKKRRERADNVVRIADRPTVKPRLKVVARAYEGASQGRLTESWLAPSTSADVEIWSGQRSLRDRSRDLVRNNPHAAGIVLSR